MPSVAVLNQLMRLFDPTITFKAVEQSTLDELQLDRKRLQRLRLQHNELQRKCAELVRRHQRLSQSARKVADRADSAELREKRLRSELTAMIRRAEAAEEAAAKRSREIMEVKSEMSKEVEEVRRVSIGLQTELERAESVTQELEAKVAKMAPQVELVQKGEEALGRMNKLEAEVEALRRALALATKKVVLHEEKAESVASDLGELTELRDASARLRSEVKQLQEQLESDRREAAEYKASTDEQILKLTGSRDLYKQQLSDLEETTLSQLNKLSEDVRMKNVDLNETKRLLARAEANLQRTQDNLRSERKSTKGLKAEVKSLQNKLLELTRNALKQQQDAKAAEEHLKNLNKTIVALRTQVADQAGEIKSLTRFKTATAELRAQNDKLTRALSVARVRSLKQANSMRSVHEVLDEVAETGRLPGAISESSASEGSGGETDSDESITSLESEMSQAGRSSDDDDDEAAVVERRGRDSIGPLARQRSVRLALDSVVSALHGQTPAVDGSVPHSGGGSTARSAARLATSDGERSSAERAGAANDEEPSGDGAPTTSRGGSVVGSTRSGTTHDQASNVVAGPVPVLEIDKQALHRSFVRRERWRKAAKAAARERRRAMHQQRMARARAEAAAVALQAAEFAGVDPKEIVSGTALEEPLAAALDGAEELPKVPLAPSMIKRLEAAAQEADGGDSDTDGEQSGREENGDAKSQASSVSETLSEAARIAREEARRQRRAGRLEQFVRKQSSQHLLNTTSSAADLASDAGSTGHAVPRPLNLGKLGGASARGTPRSASRGSRACGSDQGSGVGSGSVDSSALLARASGDDAVTRATSWLEDDVEDVLFDDVVEKVAAQARARIETERRLKQQEISLRKDAEATVVLLEELLANETVAKRDQKVELLAKCDEISRLLNVIEGKQGTILVLEGRMAKSNVRHAELDGKYRMTMEDLLVTQSQRSEERDMVRALQDDVRSAQQALEDCKAEAAAREAVLRDEIDLAKKEAASWKDRAAEFEAQHEMMCERERARRKTYADVATQVRVGGHSVAAQTDVTSFNLLESRPVPTHQLAMPQGEYYYMPSNSITMTPRPRPRSGSPVRPDSAASSRSKSRSPSRSPRAHSRTWAAQSSTAEGQHGDRGRAPPLRRRVQSVSSPDLLAAQHREQQRAPDRPHSAVPLQPRAKRPGTATTRRSSYTDEALGIVEVDDDGDDDLSGRFSPAIVPQGHSSAARPQSARPASGRSSARAANVADAANEWLGPRPVKHPGARPRQTGAAAERHNGGRQRDDAWGGSFATAATKQRAAQAQQLRRTTRTASTRTLSRTAPDNAVETLRAADGIITAGGAVSVPLAASVSQAQLLRRMIANDEPSRRVRDPASTIGGSGAAGGGGRAALHLRQSKRIHPALRAAARTHGDVVEAQRRQQDGHTAGIWSVHPSNRR